MKRGRDSETGVPSARDSETEVPEAKLAVPTIMRLESETVVDRVSETGALGGNSTGSKELSLEPFHILAAEQLKGTSVRTDPAHCLKSPTPIPRFGFCTSRPASRQPLWWTGDGQKAVDLFRVRVRFTGISHPG